MLRLLSGRGFSLPEVAIALAVAGVAVISVVGLMPGLLSSEQGSGANTAVTALATQALGYVRSQPYDPSLKDNNQLPKYTLYFGRDGKLLTDASDPLALYKCDITESLIVPDATNATAATPGTHCRTVMLDFTWPTNVSSTNNRNRKTIYATVSGG